MLSTSDKSYIEDKLTKFRSDILNHIDTVLGEVKAMREDFAILNHRSANNKNSIENHENRINTLEDKLTIN